MKEENNPFLRIGYIDPERFKREYLNEPEIPQVIYVTDDPEKEHPGPKFYRDEDGQEWCACDNPNLIHNSGGRGQAKCTDCQRPWFH